MTLVFDGVPAGSTLYIPFATYGGTNGESITLTGLAVTDIEIYKNGSITQRASDAGFALLDTDGIDFDGITGIHGFSIDLSDNTDSGFYTVGSWYWVVVSSVTVDSQTVNFIAAVFRIVAAEAVAGSPRVDVSAVAEAAIADALLGRNIAGGSDGGRTVAEALAFLRNKWTSAGGVLTVFDTDDATTLWTATLAGDNNAQPVVGVDPD